MGRVLAYGEKRDQVHSSSLIRRASPTDWPVFGKGVPHAPGGAVAPARVKRRCRAHVQDWPRAGSAHRGSGMPDVLRLLTLMVAAQSLVMGAILIAVAGWRAGKAPLSLRMRGAAMLGQCVGYVLISQRGELDAIWSVVAAFGLVVLGHALTLVALRMLLGLREYRALIALVAACVWLLMLWLGYIVQDRQAAAVLSQVYSISFAMAISWPLVRSLHAGGSVGQRILLGTAWFMLATQVWLLLAPALPIPVANSQLAVMWLVVLMPTLTGVAFLMMYSEAMQADLRRLARIDPLTGVNNRRAFFESLRAQVRACTAHSRPLAVLVIDVDDFKRVNDSYGHAAGDRLLLNLAASFSRQLRRHDVIGRIGGEEFAVIAPNAGPDEAMALAESLRTAASATTIRVEGTPLAATVSIGVANSGPPGKETDGDALLDLADKALYEAKRAGRNRVVPITGSGLPVAALTRERRA